MTREKVPGYSGLLELRMSLYPTGKPDEMQYAEEKALLPELPDGMLPETI